MATPNQPFPLPNKLPPALARFQRLWKDLIRAENEMPFSDDVDLSLLSKASANLMLIDVFAGPQRFRFNHFGEKILRKLDNNIIGKFADELEPESPFDYFIAQASATVEAGTPTLYVSRAPTRGKVRNRGYRRILLPTWGNGRVELLLGAIV
jgi:hypothetical protein